MEKIRYGSIGGSLLFVMFVGLLVLKLANIVAMSWWIVTLPLWIGFAMFVSILLIAIIVGIVLLGLYVVIIGVIAVFAGIFELFKK